MNRGEFHIKVIMCKSCGNCSKEHSGRTIDDSIDESEDSIFI
jgi:hypothetical protein